MPVVADGNKKFSEQQRPSSVTLSVDKLALARWNDNHGLSQGGETQKVGKIAEGRQEGRSVIAELEPHVDPSLLVVVVEDVVGRHCRCADGRMSRTCCDRHPKVADHLHRQVSGVDRFSCHGDLASPQDTIPLLRGDLAEVVRSRIITLFRK